MTADSYITALGLMSGTSMDGLDCCLCTISITENYTLDFEILDWKVFSYDPATRQMIRAAIENPDSIPDADKKLGILFSEFAAEFLQGREVDVVGSHGQTIAHQDGISTLQIGAPKSLSDKIGAPVVYNFRQADINAGGNGAPLMPFLDWLQFRNSKFETITLNIGGIANLTHITPGTLRKEVSGFDTGPGMALIDECVQLYWDKPMDENGKFSMNGSVIPELLTDLMKIEFIQQTPPKSTGRDEFGSRLVKKILQKYSNYRKKDILRTFIAFTAKSIAWNIQNHLKFSPRKTRLIISGGGCHHPVIISDLEKYTGINNFPDLADFGLHPDNKEAFLMAVLAAARVQSIPANMAGATGSSGDVTLGDIWE